MKTLDEIRAFWESLPGASYFANAYPAAIGAVEVADVDARTAETAALQARARHHRALAALRAQVEADAAADWSPEEIEQARRAALKQAFAIAGGVATGAESTVERHRRLARQAIGF